MLRYKVDILKELKEKDYTSYRLRKDKLIGESQIQKIRKGEIASKETLNTLQTITVSTWWHIRICRRWAINIYTN